LTVIFTEGCVSHRPWRRLVVARRHVRLSGSLQRLA
jgi:hypothetical protein